MTKNKNDKNNEIMDKKRANFISDVTDKIVRFCRAYQGPGMGKIAEITQHLHIGDYENACKISKLREFGIEVIIYLGIRNKDNNTLKKYKKRNIEHRQIPIEDVDATNLLQILEHCYEIIYAALIEERKVLIHCATGISLSPTILSYYLLKRYYITNFKTTRERTRIIIDPFTSVLPMIFKFIKDARPCVLPRGNLIYQVLMMEQSMKIHFYGIMHDNYLQKIGKQGDDSDSEPDLLTNIKETDVETVLGSESEYEPITVRKKQVKFAKSDSESDIADDQKINNEKNKDKKSKTKINQKPDQKNNDKKSKTKINKKTNNKKTKKSKTKKTKANFDKLSDLIEMQISDPDEETENNDISAESETESESSSDDILPSD